MHKFMHFQTRLCIAFRNETIGRNIHTFISGGGHVRGLCPVALKVALRKLHPLFDNKFNRTRLQQ